MTRNTITRASGSIAEGKSLSRHDGPAWKELFIPTRDKVAEQLRVHPGALEPVDTQIISLHFGLPDGEPQSLEEVAKAVHLSRVHTGYRQDRALEKIGAPKLSSPQWTKIFREIHPRSTTPGASGKPVNAEAAVLQGQSGEAAPFDSPEKLTAAVVAKNPENYGPAWKELFIPTRDKVAERLRDHQGVLDPVDAQIVSLHFGLPDGEPQSLEEVAKAVHLSRVHAGRRHDRALEKIKAPKLTSPQWTKIFHDIRPWTTMPGVFRKQVNSAVVVETNRSPKPRNEDPKKPAGLQEAIATPDTVVGRLYGYLQYLSQPQFTVLTLLSRQVPYNQIRERLRTTEEKVREIEGEGLAVLALRPSDQWPRASEYTAKPAQAMRFASTAPQDRLGSDPRTIAGTSFLEKVRYLLNDEASAGKLDEVERRVLRIRFGADNGIPRSLQSLKGFMNFDSGEIVRTQDRACRKLGLTPPSSDELRQIAWDRKPVAVKPPEVPSATKETVLGAMRNQAYVLMPCEREVIVYRWGLYNDAPLSQERTGELVGFGRTKTGEIEREALAKLGLKRD